MIVRHIGFDKTKVSIGFGHYRQERENLPSETFSVKPVRFSLIKLWGKVSSSIQISLGTQGSSESSGEQRRSDQTAPMRRLIRVFDGNMRSLIGNAVSCPVSYHRHSYVSGLEAYARYLELSFWDFHICWPSAS